MQQVGRYNEPGYEIQRLLKLEHPPIAISFTNTPPHGVKKINETVPSGCVFWIKAFEEEFYTSQNDHANCNVGSFTHGFIAPSQLSLDSCADINLMVQSEYLSLNDIGGVPRMESAAKFVAYGPLRTASFEPNVVLLVCDALQTMLVSEAMSGHCRTMGKPTCSAIPYAYNQNEVAISFGCITNRIRTGLKPTEIIVTVPVGLLDWFIGKLRQTVQANEMVSQAVAAMLG